MIIFVIGFVLFIVLFVGLGIEEGLSSKNPAGCFMWGLFIAIGAFIVWISIVARYGSM